MIIYGFNPVYEALRADSERVRFVGIASGQRVKLAKLLDVAREAGVVVKMLSGDELRKLSGNGVHNGVVAELIDRAYKDFDQVVDSDENLDLVLILDGVQDPQNLGAILRVADVFGAGLVVLPEHESAGLSPAAIKSSAGAAQWVRVAQVTNLSRAIERLQKAGFWVYGADAEGEPVTSVDFTGKVALVMGNEGKGIRQNVLKHCDRSISIPMRGHVESLNVAAATAVVAYEIDRQRRAAEAKLSPTERG